MAINGLNNPARATSDQMNVELKGVLDEFKKRTPHIEVRRTPDAAITAAATPEDVQDWMQKKTFSER